MSIKKGIYAASMTIISEDMTVLVDETIKHSEKILNDGATGCVLFGSTGQSQLISVDEKKKVIEKLSHNKFKDRFILGTGLNSLNDKIFKKYSCWFNDTFYNCYNCFIFLRKCCLLDLFFFEIPTV